MRSSLFHLFIAAALVCIYSGSTAAQEPSAKKPASGQEERREGDKAASGIRTYRIIVTASRRDASVDETASSATVIGAAVIEKSPARRVEDLLETVAGMDLWGSHLAYKCAHSVALRGTQEQGRTLVLVDGVALNDAWDDWVDWNQISMSEVERIEVIRGPHSSLYGSNAMGGAINIITSAPPRDGAEARLSASFGSLGLRSGSFRLGAGNEVFSASLSASHSESDGYLPYAARQPNETRNWSRETHLAARMRWQVDEVSVLDFSGAYLQSERNRGRAYSNVDPQQISRLSVKYDRRLPWGELRAHVWQYAEDLRWELDIGPSFDALYEAEITDIRTLGASLLSSIRLGGSGTLTVGAELKNSDIDKVDEYYTGRRRGEQGGRQFIVSLFTQHELALLDGSVTLTLGARADWWRNSGGYALDTNPRRIDPFDTVYPASRWSAFSPKLGLVYRLDDSTRLRATAGAGFRAPSPARQYLNLTRGPFLYLGNPELKPERMYAVDVGLERELGRRAWFRATAYWSRGEDFIGSRLIEPPFLMRMDNISRVGIAGIELELLFRLVQNVEGFANYTYNRSVVEEDLSNPELVGNDLQHTPRSKMNFGLTYSDPELVEATVLLHYTDDMYDDVENTRLLGGYWTVDLKLRRRISDNMTLWAQCENLLDKQYLLPSFDVYRAPGRLLTAGIALNY